MNSDDGLYQQQKYCATTHNKYYHYTNYDAVAKILNSNSFRLTKIKNQNDQMEEDRIDPIIKNKIFTASFTHSNNNATEMWEMYSNKQNGIRMSLESLAFFTKFENYLFINDNWMIRSLDLLDILYVNDPYEYFDKFFPLGEGMPAANFSKCNGFVKEFKWDTEAETRIRCYVDVTRNMPSRVFNTRDRHIALNNGSLETWTPGFNYPDFDYMYCSIPFQVLSNIKFEYHPDMTCAMQRHLTKSMLDVFNNLDSNQFQK